MSLPGDDVLAPIPEETARLAHTVCPSNTLALVLREVVGTVFHDGMFADLFPDLGQPAVAPWRLALVTILQYAENLTDREAAEQVHLRVDWRYALALPMDEQGFDASVLSTFRTRLIDNGAEERLLWAILERCTELGLLRKRGRQRTDSTHVLAAVRTLNRLELGGETIRAALEELAVADPDWLLAHVQHGWAERYGRRMEASRLPKGQQERETLAGQIGQDGVTLLAALDAADAPVTLRALPMVRCLRQVWTQQYDLTATPPRLRPSGDVPPAADLIASPYDEDARFSIKREEGWVGYKTHLTETCEADLPLLVIQVETTAATLPDQKVATEIWDDLEERDLLPGVQDADTGYVDAANLVEATTRGITLVGPVQRDSSRQTREGKGYSCDDFRIDWAAQQVRCPAGKVSSTWREGLSSKGTEAIQAHFRRADCQACPAREECTTADRRSLGLLPKALHEARQAARVRQQTSAFRQEYAHRAGVEGTISQAIRRTGLREARYRGLEKVHLQHCAEAAALNVIRLVDYLHGTPRARTRQSHLLRLLNQAA